MKCSLGISHFLEEISSLSHSIFFLYFFALTIEEGFRISPCYSLELCIQMGIFSLFSFAFPSERKLLQGDRRESQTTYKFAISLGHAWETHEVFDVVI